MEVLIVVLGSDMLPDVILLWRIMVTEITLPQRIVRVFLCYMQCKISITIALFTTVAFSFIRDKNCRGTPFGVVSWIFDVNLIALVLCVDVFVTRFINASPDFFCEPFLFATCTFIPTITILLLLFLHLALHLLLFTAKCSSCLPFFSSSLAGARLGSRDGN